MSLYVDDLLVTGNNAVMIEGFKQEMMHVFEMIDFRLMTYFLGMEVKQNKHLIKCSFARKKYARKILIWRSAKQQGRQ